jgi:hypothetical protein
VLASLLLAACGGGEGSPEPAEIDAASDRPGERCTRSDVVPDGYVCLGGRTTSCELVDASDEGGTCERCGCAEGLRCVPEVGCRPAQAVGEPCARDAECASENCSGFAGVCRVAVGDACDSSNCDRCYSFADWSWCSRECFPDECNRAGACLGDYDTGFYCYPDCGLDANAKTCPETCSRAIDGPLYCACHSCQVREPARELGRACRADGDCGSRICLATTARCDDVGACGYEGLCSQECTATDDCPSGSECAYGMCLLPCEADGDCAQGRCDSAPTQDGERMLCEPRGYSGALCRNDRDCRLAACIDGTCAGYADIGEACGFDADCIVGRCCEGTCRGACAAP